MAPTTPALRRWPMFRDGANAIATVLAGAVLVYVGYRFIAWAVTNAVWTLPADGSSMVCRAIKGRGACWAVVRERCRFVLLGSYPRGEQWRPAAACVLFVALYAATAVRAWWRPWLAVVWTVVLATAMLLLRGGAAGLALVPSDSWGGLPLTFLLSTVGFAGAFPLAVGLALGRRSPLPAVRLLSTLYVELVRGVPLITFLFMSSVMFPLFVPQGLVLDKLLRAQIAFVLVIAAFLAEVVRGGLEAVPPGQYEAAASLGLSFWRVTMLVVLPQALRVTVPALVNTYIIFFKDTSLVAIVGLVDLLGTAKAVIVDPKWVGFGVEVYLFAGAVYFAFCFAVSGYSRRLERSPAGRSGR